MLFLTSHAQKRTALVVLSFVSVLFICLQLSRSADDSYLSIPDRIWKDNQADLSPLPASHSDISESFLTYLPYSRFSNQRGTLLNAALLAKYLNRTLVVPPMFLGYANGWSPGPLLYSVVEHMTDPRLQAKCFDDDGHLIEEEPLVLEDGPTFGCVNFTAYAMVPWSEVTNLNLLTKPESQGGLGIKIIERPDLSLSSLKQQLNIGDKDMYLMEDSTRYQWHYYEDNGSPPQVNPRYKNEVSLNTLRSYPQRLLHFYGIFGFDRLKLLQPRGDDYRTRIQHALLFNHPAIIEGAGIILDQLLDGMDLTTDSIAPLDSSQAHDHEKIALLPRFVAAHVRAGDADFLKGLKRRVPIFVHELWGIMTGNETVPSDLVGTTNNKETSSDSEQQLEQERLASLPLPTAPREILDQLDGLTTPSRLAKCKALDQMILYVATDAKDPRNNPDLAPIFAAFPCTFILGDFEDTWYEPLTQISSPLDPHKDLANHLIMFVDAAICAWAERFVGTRTSTFSVSEKKILKVHQPSPRFHF
ncbi:hypothetical protein DM01DRAFT_1338558 [Hesseltinella vesiculosa]|uniref:Uncharacterized protein n=1 Tax=Hesseltinella vesiculosa TaxID=101127 RepID=A0A1X2G9I7_9FUNG|nr:hypothetical protein DM01DRAFT_1338558 [Hesseltinella vesiculosa]